MGNVMDTRGWIKKVYRELSEGQNLAFLRRCKDDGILPDELVEKINRLDEKVR